MSRKGRVKVGERGTALLAAACFLALSCGPAAAGGYDNALNGVTGLKAVYEFTQGDPKVANVILWAIKNSYEDPAVKALPTPPSIAMVFHGPAVKLISSDKALFNGAEWAEVGKFQKTLREMKRDGVKLEICLYAAKVMGVREDTVMPEIDRVGNGFVSVIGYQMQGYAVVRVP